MQLHSFSIFRGLICGWLVITLVVAEVRNKICTSITSNIRIFPLFLKDERTKRQVYQPPQVDEKLVSAFINNPEAVKMVMSYLKKQTTTTPAPRTTARTSPPRRQRPRRPPPPPLSFFFGGKKPLSQLLQEHRDTVKHLKATPTPATATPGVKGLLGPPLEALAGRLPDEDKDMQFFGPKDFVPKKAYQPPLGPMRLRYATTQEFPSRTYGRLVPMPR